MMTLIQEFAAGTKEFPDGIPERYHRLEKRGLIAYQYRYVAVGYSADVYDLTDRGQKCLDILKKMDDLRKVINDVKQKAVKHSVKWARTIITEVIVALIVALIIGFLHL